MYYKDATAMAAGVFYRPDAKSMISFSGSMGSNDNMVGVGYSQRFGKVSEFDGMTDEQFKDALTERSGDVKAIREENKSLHEENSSLRDESKDLADRLSQNEAKNEAMEQENVALKAQLAEMDSKIEALTAILDALSPATK